MSAPRPTTPTGTHDTDMKRTLIQRYTTWTHKLMADQVQRDKRENDVSLRVGPDEDAWDKLLLLSALVSDLGTEIDNNDNSRLNHNDNDNDSIPNDKDNSIPSNNDSVPSNNNDSTSRTSTSRFGIKENPTQEPILIQDYIHDPVSCETEFRFRPDDLQQVADALWPKVRRVLRGHKRAIRVIDHMAKTPHERQPDTIVPYETGLLILLFYMSRPRLVSPDMERYFGLSESNLFDIVQTFLTALGEVAVLYVQNPAILRHRFPYYARMVADASDGIVATTWGFVDGRLRQTRRPTDVQHVTYSGRPTTHKVKCQTVVTPDGLIACLHGPFPARRPDCFMMGQSELLWQLQKLMPHGGPDTVYSLYVNQTHAGSYHLFRGFFRSPAGSPEAAWNARMVSQVQEVIESAYTNVITQWSYVDFLAHSETNVFNQRDMYPCNLYFTVGAFLCNLQSCLYGNQTSNYFDANPSNGKLTMKEYLDLVKDDGTVNQN